MGQRPNRGSLPGGDIVKGKGVDQGVEDVEPGNRRLDLGQVGRPQPVREYFFGKEGAGWLGCMHVRDWAACMYAIGLHACTRLGYMRAQRAYGFVSLAWRAAWLRER